MAIADVVKSLHAERKEKENKTLEAHLDRLLTEVEQVPPLTVDSIFRASGLSDMCPRAEVLAARHNVIRENEIPAARRTAMDLGSVFHDWFRDDVLGPAGLVLGRWKCKHCHFSPDQMDGSFRYKQPQAECIQCGKGPSWTFIEEEFFNKEIGLMGHSDGMTTWEGEDWLLEMKTANSNSYRMMTKDGLPQYYIDQSQVYMDMFGHKQALFLIQNKDSGKRATIKVYKDQERIDYLYGKIRSFRQSMRDGVSLPDRICVADNCPRAEKCQLVSLCFAQ